MLCWGGSVGDGSLRSTWGLQVRRVLHRDSTAPYFSLALQAITGGRRQLFQSFRVLSNLLWGVGEFIHEIGRLLLSFQLIYPSLIRLFQDTRLRLACW